MTIQDRRYLIVGGAPRSGTTSLFEYLRAHPEVCASSIKETRFFLDADYPLESAARFDGQNLAMYGRFFPNCDAREGRMFVESTPDYLYNSTAARIGKLLPRAKIVFILRDPVDRVVSWYRYARQRALLDRSVSLEEYVTSQVKSPLRSSTPLHMRAIDQNRYEHYLRPFRRTFGERIMTLAFEDLLQDPLAVMNKIAEFAGIDASFYGVYEFHPKNASHNVRSAGLHGGYAWLRRKVAFASLGHPGILRGLRRVNSILKKVLILNSKAEQHDLEVSAAVKELILRESERPVTDLCASDENDHSSGSGR